MSEKASDRHIKRHSETSNPIFFLDDDPGFQLTNQCQQTSPRYPGK